MINSENVKIFAGTSNKDLAKKIAEKYGLPLGKADVVRFKDGEVFVKIDETVRGRDVFVVPGNINSINSVGTNELIKQGAKLVTNYKEIEY